MAEQLLAWLSAINSFLWGPWTPFILLAAGVLFTLWTKVAQFRILAHGFAVIRGKYDNPDDPGAINHFQALSAALSATIGLGNIGGVALAIGLGGPGALMWMWIVGFLGIALKTIEITLTMLYRNTDDPDEPHGGAMWVIDQTLGKKPGWKPFAKTLGGFFCISCLIMTMAGGNMFQSWNVAELTNTYFEVPQIATGIVLAVLVGLVILGGIKRIGHVAGKLVPMMCALYLLAAFAVLAVNITEIPGLLALVITKAFAPTEAGGAFLGGTAGLAFAMGMRRALFSNEAGLGSAPIAHAAAKTDEPAREGVVGGMGPLVDTLIVCTLTALVILSTNTWNRPPEGPMAGPVELVVENNTVTLNAPDAVEALPQLDAWENYHVGEQVFFMLDVANPETPDIADDRKRIRLFGEIEAGQRGEPATVQWETSDQIAVRLGWDSFPTDVRFADRPNGSPEDRVFRDFKGASLTAHAFDRAFPGLGKWLITLGAWLFAISTMISWSYYGEQSTFYLFGRLGIIPYKLAFLLFAILGTVWVQTDKQLGNLIDFGLGWMLWANMFIVLLMAPRAVGALSDYFKRLDAGEFTPHEAAKMTDIIEGKDHDEKKD